MKNKSELLSELVKNSESAKDCEVESRFTKYLNGIACETYNINTDEQSKYYKKDKGEYAILNIPDVLFLRNNQLLYIRKCLVEILRKFFGRIKTNDKILVVGLGNRHISSDSLGTKVVSKINVTVDSGSKPRTMAMCPSVMGLTGIESYDIVSGVAKNVKPTCIVLIDCLCAGAVERLGKSIQISNTGICPGSGIGNIRKCIDTSLAPKVISIGVPLLIYANTFLDSAFSASGIQYADITNIMQKCKKMSNNAVFEEFVLKVKKLYNIDFRDIIVSTKDIEESVEILSTIIADSINDCIKVCE